MGRSLAVFDAPSNLGLQPPQPGKVPGVDKLAGALRAQGLVSRLGAFDAGWLIPPAYQPDIDQDTGMRNSAAIRAFSIKLAKQVQAVIGAGYMPIVLGGDCSILLGNMLALRQLGHYGLFFIDGHSDLQTPATSQTGGAAGMDLALVTGRGPEVLTNIERLKPFVRDTDVIVFGYREGGQTDLNGYDFARVRQLGVIQAAEEGLAALHAADLDGFWIHLDADVLDDTIMPAVDSRQPGGMSYTELIELLRILLASEQVAGMDITIFDPELDPDGSIAAAFTTALVDAFTCID